MKSIASNGLNGVHGLAAQQLVEREASQDTENAKIWRLTKSTTTQFLLKQASSQLQNVRVQVSKGNLVMLELVQHQIVRN